MQIKNLKKDSLIVFISIFVAAISMCVSIAGDDIGVLQTNGGTIVDCWERNALLYNNWSSRVIVNFIAIIFANSKSVVYWAVFNGFSMLNLLFSFKLLFLYDEDRYRDGKIFMTCMVLLLPYGVLSSAGWIATMTTYFSPLAFGFMSLVPIKKVWNNEKIKWWQICYYYLCLLYGTNSEQVMVVIVVSYLVAFMGYLFVESKINIILLLFFITSVASAIFIVTCSGNVQRTIAETENWFAGFNHLNFIDKIALGYETAVHWLVFENNLFFESSTSILCFLVFKRYEDSFVRILSTIPVIVTVGLGALKQIIVGIFPYIENIASEIPYWGLVNAQNRGGLGPFTEFLVMSLCLLILFIDVFLLCSSWKQLAVSFSLLTGGLASRVAIGFSPTIYASGFRTNFVMSCCIVAVVVYLYSTRQDSTVCEIILDSKNRSIQTSETKNYVLVIMIFLALLNIVYAFFISFR